MYSLSFCFVEKFDSIEIYATMMMEATQVFIKNIIKTQNAQLLQDIAEKFGLDPQILKQKYLAPTFYSVETKKI